MKAMMSARSFSFLRPAKTIFVPGMYFFGPAKTIFVPGMYFFGFTRYSYMCLSDQMIPEALFGQAHVRVPREPEEVHP